MVLNKGTKKIQGNPDRWNVQIGGDEWNVRIWLNMNFVEIGRNLNMNIPKFALSQL